MELNAVVSAFDGAAILGIAGARPCTPNIVYWLSRLTENAVSLMLVAEYGVRGGHDSVVTVQRLQEF